MKTYTVCSALLVFVVAILFSSPTVEGGQMERLAALALVLKSLGGRGGGGGALHPAMMNMGMGGFPGKVIPIPIHGMKPKKCKEKVKIIVIQGKHHGLNNLHGGNAFVEYPGPLQSEMHGSHMNQDYSKYLIGGTQPVFKVASIGSSGGSSLGGSLDGKQSQHEGSWSSNHYSGQAQSGGGLSSGDLSGGLSASGSSLSSRIVYINDYKGQATKMLYDKHLQDTQGTWDEQF